MGGTNSYPKEYEAHLEKYQKREVVNDERFGEVTIYNLRHAPAEQMIVKQKWHATEGDAAELEGIATNRTTIGHKALAKMYHQGLKREDQMCSTFYKHFMAFEYYPNNMAKEIQQRRKLPANSNETKCYSEPEIWYIIRNLSEVLSNFEARGYHHGDIQPKNILIDPHGFVKIIDNSLINYGENAYTKKILSNKSYSAAFSPELMASVPFGEIYPNVDPVKSDVFSLGITALCASLNQDVDHYYDWPKQEINYANIKAGLTEMRRAGFSQELVSTVEEMLARDPNHRPTVDQLSGEFRKLPQHHGYAKLDQSAQLHYGNSSAASNGRPSAPLNPPQPGFLASTPAKVVTNSTPLTSNPLSSFRQ